MELLSPSSPHALQLLIAPHAFQQEIVVRFTVDLALSGPVRILDGGNRFDVLRVNRELRRKERNVYPVLGRIQVARAFTCYQMAALLTSSGGDSTPTLVLNLLATFRDENVPLPERQRLLGNALCGLRCAVRRAPAMIVLHPPPVEDPFLAAVQEAVEQVWVFEAPRPPGQLSLFDHRS